MAFHHAYGGARCGAAACLAGTCPVAARVAEEARLFKAHAASAVARGDMRGTKAEIKRVRKQELEARARVFARRQAQFPHTDNEEFKGVQYSAEEIAARSEAQPEHIKKSLDDCVPKLHNFAAHTALKTSQAGSCKGDLHELQPGEIMLKIDYASRLPVSLAQSAVLAFYKRERES